MEITETSIHCTHEEAKLIGVSLTMHRLENTCNIEIIDEIRRIEDYIRDANSSIYQLAEARLRFDTRRDPTEVEVIEMLRSLGEKFISITRSVEVDKLVSLSVSNFTWNVFNNTYSIYEVDDKVKTFASELNVELMVGLNSDLS